MRSSLECRSCWTSFQLCLKFYIVGQGHSNPFWNVTVVQVCKKYNEGIISELHSYQIDSSVFSINRENLWKQALNSIAVLWREYGVINLGLSSFLVSIEVNLRPVLDANWTNGYKMHWTICVIRRKQWLEPKTNGLMIRDTFVQISKYSARRLIGSQII